MVDRRTQADRDKGGSLPTGQTSRGFPASESRNPKNNSSRRPDVVGKVPGEGGAVDQQTTRMVSPQGFPGSTVPSKFSAGSGSTEPSPDSVNRGYTEVTGSNVPTVRTVTSANRQNFGIDPGTPPQPSGDTTDDPIRPRYGVGTTGE